MRKLYSVSAAVVFLLNTSIHRANAFQLAITNRAYPGAGALIQTQLDQMANNIENQFNQSIASSTNQTNFLNAVGNANAGSARSYISPGVVSGSNHFLLNAGASAAISVGEGASISDGIKFPSNQLPPIGVGAKTGITFGLGGKFLRLPIGLDPSRMMYSFSFFSADLSETIGHGVRLKSSQLSVGAAYQFYLPQAWSPLIRYNGIRIASGLSYASFDASYRTPFNLTSTDAATNSQMTWNNNIDLGVTSKIVSITNEVTTGIRLLWIFNLYTGIGLDFNFGSSSITGGSSGPVTATSSGSTVFTGTGSVTGDSESAAPTIAQFRYLLGAQIDLGAFGIYVQGQVSTPSVYALNLGAHVAF